MNNQTSKSKISQSVRLCLIGFMGAGKTATAEILASKLSAAWIDLDEFIEARESRRIAQIIETLGEQVFREIETDALREATQTEENNVLAVGGGTWTVEANRQILENANYRSIWLDAGFELCWKRISEAAQANRPLARNKTQTHKLFSARRGIYQTADIHIKITKRKMTDAVAFEIIEQLASATSKPFKLIDKTGLSR